MTDASTDEIAKGLATILNGITSSLADAQERAATTGRTAPLFFPEGIELIYLKLSLSKDIELSLAIAGERAKYPSDAKGAVHAHLSSAKEEEFDAENLLPPPPKPLGPNDPTAADESDRAKILTVENVKSIAGVASLYSQSCTGGDRYINNCAHFLSDAFIRAGYDELRISAPATSSARCGTPAKRPIRAREMQDWFEKMAKEKRTELPKNEGLWAVFQLDEKEYWGGHVVIIDTDHNRYYGTANYPSWNQNCYKW